MGLGLNWKVTECEFDRESGVVRLRIEETDRLWEAERSPGRGAKVACYDHTEEGAFRQHAAGRRHDRNPLGGILAHWERKATNAFLEALNSVFSAVNLRIPATH